MFKAHEVHNIKCSYSQLSIQVFNMCQNISNS